MAIKRDLVVTSSNLVYDNDYHYFKSTRCPFIDIHKMPSKFKFFQRSLITTFTCLGAIAFNTTTTAQNNSSPKIVTTFLPVHLFTKAVVGDTGEVDILISPGAEVHDYQATPNDAKLLAQADVLVENGLGIEEFLSGLVANAGNSNFSKLMLVKGLK